MRLLLSAMMLMETILLRTRGGPRGGRMDSECLVRMLIVECLTGRWRYGVTILDCKGLRKVGKNCCF